VSDAPSGWYADPAAPGFARYWDGGRWAPGSQHQSNNPKPLPEPVAPVADLRQLGRTDVALMPADSVAVSQPETKTCPRCGVDREAATKFCRSCVYQFVKQEPTGFARVVYRLGRFGRWMTAHDRTDIDSTQQDFKSRLLVSQLRCMAWSIVICVAIGIFSALFQASLGH
jgi:hypothetical protein